MKTAIVLRHVYFEDLGILAPALEARDYQVSYRTVGDPGFLNFDPLLPDLLVVLGGPIGVYEVDIYPFLLKEIELVASRLAAGKPLLGICLGAQLIAAAAGAAVFPSGVKEIGFAPIDLSPAGHDGPLRHLADIPVLHWHGDTYELPAGAVHLASTPLVQQQAFAFGSSILGLQFHAEVDPRMGFERWLVGHASELATSHIDVSNLRDEAERVGASLTAASVKLFDEWLDGLGRA